MNLNGSWVALSEGGYHQSGSWRGVYHLNIDLTLKRGDYLYVNVYNAEGTETYPQNFSISRL